MTEAKNLLLKEHLKNLALRLKRTDINLLHILGLVKE